MLIPFYLGEKPDSAGRMIQEIWDWDSERLECTHNYIQWLFPISEKSAFNPDAPVLDEKTIETFRENPHLQQSLRKSLTVMLRFYGLQRHENTEEKIVISKSIDYPNRKIEWLCIFDHNYLRITRILKCLMILGLQNEAQAFFNCLEEIYREDSDRIGGETFEYWKNAV
jgi:hypothetical protein